MKIKSLRSSRLFGYILVSLTFTFCSSGVKEDNLTVHFDRDAKIEVGSHYVGIEMHHSSPLLQRISFYYPVANSIDLSTDYWKRDTSFISSLGLKIGDGARVWLGKQIQPFEQTPFSITFHDSTDQRSVKITYRFFKDKPAFAVFYEITNNSSAENIFEFETHLSTILRTCHAFTKIDKAWTDYNRRNVTLFTNFTDVATQSAQVFVTNAGEMPVAFNGDTPFQTVQFDNKEWCDVSSEENVPVIHKDEMKEPGVHYKYSKVLKPSEAMSVVQIIGSCRQDEGVELVKYLVGNYKNEIDKFEKSVCQYVYDDAVFKTGDGAIDQSVNWAKAILAVNQHYLDGDIVPMPCPAEYNFFFSHDVLVTDLSAVNFDLARVKHDLSYIVQHADNDKIIPHAYYWRDSTYLTEYANFDNWNNYWFILVSASYLRHSGDKAFVESLYPYLSKSIESMLKTKGAGDLMWSYRPDWWDIGRNYGPRSYMTILAITTLREYNFVSSSIGMNEDKLIEYENLADRMQTQLTNKLWDGNQKYLLNYYEPAKIDTHYYTGSLLAAHFNLLDDEKKNMLVHTATEKLLDEKVGVYNAYPMDFHELRDYLNFSGNEAGDQFFYFNGGIWPQGNAWYALSLITDNKKAEAAKFIKDVMTLDGLMKLPNGQPAMYEVRNGNYSDSTTYGSVDKPQFMWAAAWYLYCLYHLNGINENEWNISLTPYLNANQSSCEMTLTLNGNKVLYNIEGEGSYIKNIFIDSREVCSAVILPQGNDVKKINVKLGVPYKPILTYTEARVIACDYDEQLKEMKIELNAFAGHANKTKIISPFNPVGLFVNGSKADGKLVVVEDNGVFEITINFAHETEDDVLKLFFDAQ